LIAGQPLEIERDRLVGLAERGNQMPAESACRAPRAQAIEHPAAFAKAIEEAGFAEEFQVTGHARLALPEDLRQLADRQLAAGAQHQEAQPRRFPRPRARRRAARPSMRRSQIAIHG